MKELHKLKVYFCYRDLDLFIGEQGNTFTYVNIIESFNHIKQHILIKPKPTFPMMRMIKIQCFRNRRLHNPPILTTETIGPK